MLREQITGIRVVRAFVREPEETERFGDANDDLTEMSLRAGRLMAFDVPDRHARHQRVERRRALARRRAASTAGEIQVGSLSPSSATSCRS